MPLLSFFQRQPGLRRQAAAVYSQLVAQARHPWFYATAAVPDTLDGRFEMITLHLFLLQHCLKSAPEQQPMAQAILEAAFDDLDRSLRELGVGDMGVARRIRQMADGIYGRFEAYATALPDTSSLQEALRRNLYGTAPDATPEAVAKMTEYTQQQLRQWQDLSAAELANGHWPEAVFPALR